MAIKKREQKPLEKEFSAGGAVFRKVKGHKQSLPLRGNSKVKIFWLLIRPAGTNRWQLPKGNIERGEKAQETAVREVFEETSVHARVVEKIDVVRYFYVRDGARITKSVTFFLMEYVAGQAGVSRGSEHEIDRVEFIPTNEALARLTFKDDKEVVRKAEERLRKGVQESLV